MMGRIRVAIFGAGVAGLTAAHELAARGFNVKVFDGSLKASGGIPAAYLVGGVARTQYHRFPDDTPIDKVRKKRVPGEHGFRFFPSFYRHLTHTMRRIPTISVKSIVGPPSGSSGSGAHGSAPTAGGGGSISEFGQSRIGPFQSTSDNLVATRLQGISTGEGGELYVQDRRMPRSFDAAQRTVLSSLRGFDYRSIDLARFTLKILQFMTTCSARRMREYQEMSWWDFLGGDRYEARFRDHMNSVTRALVAMDAERSDALTQGTILVQLMKDQLSDGSETDRLLNGPTSDQWLRHWHDFITTGAEGGDGNTVLRPASEEQVVEFVPGRLKNFELDGDSIRSAVIEDYSDNDTKIVNGEFDYYILGVDLGAILAKGGDELITEAMADADARQHPEDPALRRLRQLAALPEDSHSAWMSGLQFYLSEHVDILPGHVYFPDSEWGLSAVSQSQFWGSDTRVRFGHGQIRSIISVIISRWDVPGRVFNKAARSCTKEQLGIEVWDQLRAGLLPAGIRLAELNERTLPEKIYVGHHVDHYLVDKDGMPVCDCATDKDGKSLSGDRPIHENKAPVFICPPGTWGLRPGSPHDGYRLHLGNLVLCGAYAQTHTALPTMEAANESARHAVNAILRNEEKKLAAGEVVGITAARFEKCQIFPPEEHEFDDLRSLKRIDEMLFDHGDPHMFDILHLERMIDATMPRGRDGSAGWPAEQIHEALHAFMASERRRRR
jgi:uncharacterized protein with NAD-binding domain and iron-sulfur cluster